jgi:hypothetical protein
VCVGIAFVSVTFTRIRVKLTLVCVESILCVYNLHSACIIYTLRVVITLERVEITLERVEITLERVEITL